jgi:hypothetical protein
MKRIAYIWLAGLVVAGTLSPLGAQTQTEPLGDYARTVRKDKEKQPPAAKKYDNDNLPKNDDVSVVGNATAEPDDKSSASSEQKADDKTADSKDDQQKASDEWKKKIAEQKDQIDLLSRELDVLQREYRLRAAAFYADAGNRRRRLGQGRRPVQTADCRQTESCRRRQEAARRSSGAGSQSTHICTRSHSRAAVAG